MSLRNELRNWRNNQARIEGVEGYRVLSNTVLEALVGALPQSKEEMLAIKGIKEAKYGKYGGALLKMIAQYSVGTGNTADVLFMGETGRMKYEAGKEKRESHILNLESERENIQEENVDQTMSVSAFLDGLNVELSGMAARVQGEVSSVDERDRVVYFTLKDSQDESTINCLIFRYQYDVSGVRIAIGDEIIVEGVPDIYKPSGRLSLKVGIIELSGAGALQKAYEALKLKMEQDGLFAVEKKRALPPFPERIALITSEQGAAIGDFTMNLGAQGLQVDFYPTAVEGKKAVFEIIQALQYFEKHADQYDILVMVRGGGSLESLQAFNNEALVRQVASSRIPTLLGIGHEKDVTLAALVADVMVSTPTATARTLRAPFDEARGQVLHHERVLVTTYEQVLINADHQIGSASRVLVGALDSFTQHFQVLREQFFRVVPEMDFRLRAMIEQVSRLTNEMMSRYERMFGDTKSRMQDLESTLKRYDPKRALALGYSLIHKEGKILRSVVGLKKGDSLSLRLVDGQVDSRVTDVYTE